MSENVITLHQKADQETDEHGAGLARCLACGHEWQAVAKIGTVWLDCPECHCAKGVFDTPFAASEGHLTWTCNCGCPVFYITADAVRCCNCGAQQRPFDDDSPGRQA